MSSLIPWAQKTPRYGVLLGVLLILVVVAPILPAAARGHWIEFFFDLVLLSGAYSAAWDTKHRWPFVALTVATLAVRWTEIFAGHTGFSLGSIAITIVWMTYAIVLIVAALFKMRGVDTDSIFGAIIAYLLAAVAFAFLFELVELSQPGSFSGLPVGGTQREMGNAMLYFSFVCLTTMGYGDIVPVSALARPLSVLEGVFGILYLAVMIARLVGLHIVSAGQPDDLQ